MITPAQLAHAYGFDNVTEIAEMIGRNVSTLYDWSLRNPKHLETVIAGCAETKKNQQRGSGNE